MKRQHDRVHWHGSLLFLLDDEGTQRVELLLVLKEMGVAGPVRVSDHWCRCVLQEQKKKTSTEHLVFVSLHLYLCVCSF